MRGYWCVVCVYSYVVCVHLIKGSMIDVSMCLGTIACFRGCRAHTHNPTFTLTHNHTEAHTHRNTHSPTQTLRYTDYNWIHLMDTANCLDWQRGHGKWSGPGHLD